MFIRGLHLKNFRNYSDINLEFDKNTILIIGDNGQGKTNLLEAIYYISSGKSHRTNIQDELVKWNSEYALIRADIKGHLKDHLIELEFRPGNRNKIRVDRVIYKKKSDFISILPSVIFSPDDLAIVKGSPSRRRDFLDEILERICHDYYFLRIQYQKILNQRNSLIKSINSQEKVRDNLVVDTWDENLIKYGAEIIFRRICLLSELKDKFNDEMGRFFKGAKAELVYIFSWDRNYLDTNPGSHSSAKFNPRTILNSIGSDSLTDNGSLSCEKDIILENFRKKLKENFTRELSYKTTITGPHRDDFAIMFNGRDIRSFGSQGQQRIASVSLKFCECEIINKKLKKNPVLLLDDILSELDSKRERQVLNMIRGRYQTFITTSNVNYVSHIEEIEDDKIQELLVKDNTISLLKK